MEDIQGESPRAKMDMPRRFPPMIALVNSRPLAAPSFTFRTFARSTKGKVILLPKT
jgi:hypothetical protein